MREAPSPLLFPPARQGSDGKLRGISGGAYIDRATIVADIIDPVGHGSQQGIVRKVMHIDRRGFLPPRSSGVFEVANQLFLLGIHTDDRPADSLKGLPLARDDLKLLLAIWVGAAGLTLFRIHAQGITQLA